MNDISIVNLIFLTLICQKWSQSTFQYFLMRHNQIFGARSSVQTSCFTHALTLGKLNRLFLLKGRWKSGLWLFKNPFLFIISKGDYMLSMTRSIYRSFGLLFPMVFKGVLLYFLWTKKGRFCLNSNSPSQFVQR